MIIKCVKCKKEINPMVELGIYGGCVMQGLDYICFKCFSEPPAQNKGKKMLSKKEIDYPRDVFNEIITGDSPYAFYLHQWVPYQTDAKRFRLKMLHDVKHFDGREELGIWPNADSCGSFKDDEVEFIRISKKQL